LLLLHQGVFFPLGTADILLSPLLDEDTFEVNMFNIFFVHVKGHSKNIFNEIADFHANEGATGIILKHGFR